MEIYDELIKLTKEELEVLFKKYSVTELEKLISILNCVVDYDVKLDIEIAKKVYEEKLSKYPVSINISDKVSLSSLTRVNHNLTTKELEHIYVIVDDASMVIANNLDDDNEKINCEISKLEGLLYNELNNRKNNEKIVKELFNKYSLAGLIIIRTLLDSVKKYDVKFAKTIINDVSKEKLYAPSNEFTVPISYRLSDIEEAYKTLNLNELDFLYKIACNASLYLQIIDSKILDDDKLKVTKICDSLFNEIEKRKNNDEKMFTSIKLKIKKGA